MNNLRQNPPTLPSQPVWEGISSLLQTLWSARLLVIFNTIIFIIFTYTDQGYDMLLALPEGALGRILWFVLFTAVAGYLIWYSGRFFINLNYTATGEEDASSNYYWKYYIPRYLAVQLPVILSTTLYHLGSYQCSREHHTILWIGGALIIPYLILKGLDWWFKHLMKPALFWAIVSGLLLLILGGAIRDQKHHGVYLIAAGQLLLALLLGSYFYIRRHQAYYGYLSILKNIHPRLVAWTFTALLVLSFICFNVMDDVRSIFPYPVLISGMSLYLVGIGLLFATSRQTRFFTVTAVLVLLGLIIYLNNQPFNTHLHEVHYATAPSLPLERQALPDHFEAWLSHRQKKMRQKDPYPIFMVVGEGGGSRAGLWMSHLLASIQDSTDGAFTEHMYAMSTVSGSTTGAGTFIYFLKNNYGNLGQRSRIMFQTNYLSSSLAHLMGQDALKSIIPGIYRERDGRHRDRAAQLEKEWTIGAWNALHGHDGYDLRPTADSSMQLPFTSFWQAYDGQYDLEMPLLFANTTRVETGRPAAVSAVRLHSADPAFDILSHLEKDDHHLSLITGMHLSSRFPIINAMGKIDGLGHFVDGGYYDNSGASTMNHILAELSRYAFTDTFEINLILVRNQKPGMPSTKNQLQITGPLVTLLNTRSGHSYQAVETLLNQFSASQVFTFDLQHDQTHCDVLPLARFLSARAAEIIMEDVQEGQNRENFQRLVHKIRLYEQKNRLSYVD